MKLFSMHNLQDYFIYCLLRVIGQPTRHEDHLDFTAISTDTVGLPARGGMN
jgi:hypothetical protein